MGADQSRNPILVDTDGLIAVANSPLWETLVKTVGMTTTNVCEQELKRHRDEYRPTAPEGSRPYRLHHGSVRVLEALEDDGLPLTRVVCVPRPHGVDAGEQSIRQEVLENPERVDLVVLMDAGGRRNIRREVQSQDFDVNVLAPTYLFYILYDTDHITREEFCEACADMLRTEGWTGYQAVKAAWEGIPVECMDVIDGGLLPN